MLGSGEWADKLDTGLNWILNCSLEADLRYMNLETHTFESSVTQSAHVHVEGATDGRTRYERVYEAPSQACLAWEKGILMLRARPSAPGVGGLLGGRGNYIN